MSSNQIKVILVGESGVGKTAYINRITVGHVMTQGLTDGLNLVQLPVKTNFGTAQFNIYDCGGYHKGLDDGYYIGAQGAILMIDPSTTKNTINSWIKTIHRVCEGIPIVLARNHRNAGTLNSSSGISTIQNYPVYDLDLKSADNCERPFLSLLRSISQEPKVEFV